MINTSRCMAIVTMLFFVHGVVLAATYYVDPAGNDSADGTTLSTAWKTLARVENQSLVAGDTVELSPGGTWRESIKLRGRGSAEKPVTLRTRATTRVVRPGSRDDSNEDKPENAVIASGGDYCIDASESHVVIEHLTLSNARHPHRGAITIWADRNLNDITIRDCTITRSAGRGIWISGDDGRRVEQINITGNRFIDNAGSGILVSKLAESTIDGNTFTGNCYKEVDPWQAAIRVWSADVHDLSITRNLIFEPATALRARSPVIPPATPPEPRPTPSTSLLSHVRSTATSTDGGDSRKPEESGESAQSGKAAVLNRGMGIHIDETGAGVIVANNAVSDSASVGIEIENTRGVVVKCNAVRRIDTGIFIYRAGHEHVIESNIIEARSLGIVLQGHRARGVDAGPELELNGGLVTKNVVRNNKVRADKWAALKVVGGAETGGNRFDNNDLGEPRAGRIEWGSAARSGE